MNTSCMRDVRYFTKVELKKANRQAIEAGGRAIEPEYVDGLSDTFRYPIFFAMPWERHGWVRCQVGTGVPGHDYTPLFIDVPQEMYEKLGAIEMPVDEEAAP